MKQFFFIILLTLAAKAFSIEVSWETLKTLDLDPKTKSPLAKGELKKY